MRRPSPPGPAALAVLAAALGACSDPPAALDPGPDAAPLVDAAPAIDAAPLVDYCNADDPRPTPVAVYPTPESGERPYTDVLDTATSSIDVAIYLMGYGGILDRLEAKARAGVTVRVILDGGQTDTNQKYFDRLTAAGAQVKWSNPQFSYFHNKYFVVDGQVAVLSTGNYSKQYSIDLERNFAVVDRDAADVADLHELFVADWTGAAPRLSCTRMVVSPVNARARILAVVNGARHTLDIQSMQFADSEVRNAVRARVAAGVTVRVILADASWVSANASAATFLAGLGVPVRWIPHNHTKVIVADGTMAYVGSENLSYTSLEKNREVGVVTVEASSIAPLTATFTGDWARATPF